MPEVNNLWIGIIQSYGSPLRQPQEKSRQIRMVHQSIRSLKSNSRQQCFDVTNNQFVKNPTIFAIRKSQIIDCCSECLRSKQLNSKHKNPSDEPGQPRIFERLEPSNFGSCSSSEGLSQVKRNAQTVLRGISLRNFVYDTIKTINLRTFSFNKYSSNETVVKHVPVGWIKIKKLSLFK